MNTAKYAVERGVKVKSSQLHPNNWNPNKTNPRQQAAIKESLLYFGQLVEIVVRPHPTIEGEYEVIDGEHRLQELNGEVYVNVVNGLSEDESKRLTIIFNETRGEADKIELSHLLEELSRTNSTEHLLIGLPYDETELEELINISGIDWDSYNQSTSASFESLDLSSSEGLTLTATVDANTYEKLENLKESLALDKIPDALAWGRVLSELVSSR